MVIVLSPMVYYFLSAYVIVPTFLSLYHHPKVLPLYYQICPLVTCWKSLLECVQEDECKDFLMKLQECDQDGSELRNLAVAKFAQTVQHPNDPTYCRYIVFDTYMTTTKSLQFVECVGSSQCLQPSEYTDECYNFDLDDAGSTVNAIPFQTIEPNLDGTWKKLFTTGWDQWPCQTTQFHSPMNKRRSRDGDGHNQHYPEPEGWMDHWPTSDSVWRMDLSWKNDINSNITFHMCNEMYPGQRWEFNGDEEEKDGGGDGGESSSSSPTTSAATTTLKTKAVMWGTEAHENWYVLDYDTENEVLLMYYCAYTGDINRFDSAAVVWQKEQERQHQEFGGEDDGNGEASRPRPPLSEEQLASIQQKALSILGPKFGTLQRIEECQ